MIKVMGVMIDERSKCTKPLDFTNHVSHTNKVSGVSVQVSGLV